MFQRVRDPESGNLFTSLYALLGLQRARVRAISLRAQDLRPAAQATEQLTLDPGDDRALAIEVVSDRARYGPGTLRPATFATGTKRSSPVVRRTLTFLPAMPPSEGTERPPPACR